MSPDRELEDAVYAATRAAIGEPPLATSPLVRAIIDRSERYTSDRARLATPFDKTGDLAARAVFFTIADAMKISIPLAELANRDALPGTRPLRVIDLGAGCGAMSLGMIETVVELPQAARPSLEILAIDRDAAALGIAAAAVRSLAATRKLSVTITTKVDDVASAKLPACDLVIAGTLLNELAADARLSLVERALAAISDEGALILIEPALRETARGLHELRDAILARGAAHVFAPCTRTVAQCPALTDPDDWCHEDRAIKLPPKTAELARLTHLRDGGMKFSYLVLRRTALSHIAEPGAWRIVSSIRTQKGKLEVTGCGTPGWVPLRLLKRNRADRNRDLERAERGDVVVISTEARDGASQRMLASGAEGERVEVGEDTTVIRREPSKLR